MSILLAFLGGRISRLFCWGLSVAFLLPVTLLPTTSFAMDHVTLERAGKTIQLSGVIEIEAQNGGLLFRSRDGVLWRIQPEEIAGREQDDEPFKAFGSEELSTRLLADLPAGFRVHRTAHYILCYNTSAAYAEWCGSLYERLFRGFYNYWSYLDVRLEDPDTPLVAFIFDTKESYARYAKQELGTDIGPIPGYYNMETNRMNMYDLTGVEAGGAGRVSSADRINRILRQPSAAHNVATIVHEGTHQLAYNSGLQVRYADNPFWVSEGLAVYFESPDLSSSKGWRGIGTINRSRMVQFRKYLRNRPADSLTTLLADDKRFRDSAQALDSYAEAWALNYFLLKTRKRDYVRYLKALGEKKPLIEVGPDGRIAEFKAVFGSDLEAFDKQFIRYMRR